MNRLRGAPGLEQHRLKVIEPLQMLGEIEEDLLKAVHSDFVGLWNRGNMMGFMQDDWKPFDMDDGTPTWMGGVDTRRALPFGTLEEVRAQVGERVRILNKNGGYIINPIHNVVANVPTENLIAMYETVLGEKLR